MSEGKRSPPYVLALLAVVLAVTLDLTDVTKLVISAFAAPSFSTSDEYLMLRIDSEDETRRTLENVQEQVAGVYFSDMDRVVQLMSSEQKARDVFCNDNSSTYPEAFSSPQAPERLALVQECLDQASSWAVLVTYAVKSFDGQPISGIEVDYVEFEDSDDRTPGAINAYDGFLDADLRENGSCLWARDVEMCIGRESSRGSWTEVPTIGPGEMVLFPLFVTWHFEWSRTSPDSAPESMGFDGFAPTPVRLPVRVEAGRAVLVDDFRPMRATPTLTHGFYSGRG